MFYKYINYLRYSLVITIHRYDFLKHLESLQFSYLLNTILLYLLYIHYNIHLCYALFAISFEWYFNESLSFAVLKSLKNIIHNTYNMGIRTIRIIIPNDYTYYTSRLFIWLPIQYYRYIIYKSFHNEIVEVNIFYYLLRGYVKNQI